MQNPAKLTPIVSIGLILIAVSVAVFFLGTAAPRTTLDFMALTFVLLSEAAFFGGLIFLALSRASFGKRVIQLGILSTLGIYWAATILLALFRGAFAETPGNYLIVNLIAAGIVAVLCVLLGVAAGHVQSTNEQTGNIDTAGRRGGF